MILPYRGILPTDNQQVTENKKILAIFSTKIDFGEFYRKETQVKYVFY